jgi:hypothetical protein
VLAAVLAVASLVHSSFQRLLAIVYRTLVVFWSRDSNIVISVRCYGAGTERHGCCTKGWYLPSVHKVKLGSKLICPHRSTRRSRATKD